VTIAADGWKVSAPLNIMEEPLQGADEIVPPFAIRSWRLARR
jgi:hypothetical protein